MAPERRLPASAEALSALIDGQSVALQWTNPTKRLDGAALRDLSVVKLHRRAEPEAGEPKSAMLSSGRVVGYEEIATIRLDEAGSTRAERATTRWTDRRGLTPGQRYVYVVTAIDATGRSSPPSSRLVVDFVAAPGAPRELSATPGDGQVALRWLPPTAFIDGTPPTGALRYLILRSVDPDAPAAPVTPEPIAATEWSDTGLVNETAYRYSVRAVRTSPGGIRALGEASAAVTATPVDTTPPAPPTELVAIPGAAAVRLAWRPSADTDVALYAIYRAGASGDFLRVGTTAAINTVFIDREVTPGAQYRYVVTALDRARRPNESPRSNEARVRAE